MPNDRNKSIDGEKCNWTVHMRVTVNKTVVCAECTREQALKEPWEYAVDEIEEEQVDWVVRRIEESE